MYLGDLLGRREVGVHLPNLAVALLHLLQFYKLPVFLQLTNTDSFEACFVVSGDATSTCAGNHHPGGNPGAN